MEPVHTEELNGATIEIIPDEDRDSPRDWDNLGTMVCFHSRYHLGDEQPTESWAAHLLSLLGEEFADKLLSWNEAEYAKRCHHLSGREYFKAEAELGEDYRGRIVDEFMTRFIALPLYLYDHSGITMNTSGFHCPWDSGQVGWIYVSREDALKEYSRKRMSGKLRDKVEQVLRGEVEVYDQYLRGDVYGYVVKMKDKTEDSCWGFYGMDYCLEEARRIAS
jgi:hypothetical protein